MFSQYITVLALMHDAHLHLVRDLHLSIPIYFAVGDVRSCGTVFIPGNTYVDKLEREKQIIFVVEESEFSDFVSFKRDSAWCFIADDDGT